MRVLFVISGLGIGGAQKSTVAMINAANKNKYEIDLLIFNENENALCNTINPPVRRVYLSGKGRLFFDSMKKSVLQFIKQGDLRLAIKRIINPFKIRRHKNIYPEQLIWEQINKQIDNLSGKYDVAIACCQGLPTYYVVDKVSARYKVAWMRSDATKQKHDVLFTKNYYKQYDLINTISKGAYEGFLATYPELSNIVKIFYNIIDSNEVLELSNEPNNFIDKKSFSICTVGRLCEAKGYFLAIECCYFLVKQKIPVKWYVVGEGSLRKELESEIATKGLKDSFLLLGEQSNPFSYIKQCNLYVQSSLWEGYCRTLAEARILCKPIVTTNFPSAIEQIEDGLTGVICKMDSKSMADAIVQLYENKDEMERLSLNLRKCTNTDNGTSRFDEMIDSLIKRGK